MRTPDFYKDQRKGTISDLMLFAFETQQPKYIAIEDFLPIAFGYAKAIFPHENKFNSKRVDEINLVKALTFITYTKYRRQVSLRELGIKIAHVIGRNKPFDHASILAKLKEHVKAATFKYSGYEIYMARYTKLVGELREGVYL